MGKGFLSRAGAMAMSFFVLVVVVHAQSGWYNDARATFYGDASGSETMKMGACGYDEKSGYGLANTALSTALFHDGMACGACFQIQCVNSQFCHPGKSITVTATNFCPPDYSKNESIWCNPPQKHFDLSQPMFLQIAEYRAGVVPVQYRRVPCVKQGGMKFYIQGNPWWMMVLVYNVAGAGDVVSMYVKGSNTGWLPMTKNWGQHWQYFGKLQGQSLSFRVRASDMKLVQSDNVAPANWQFNQTFEGKQF